MLNPFIAERIVGGENEISQRLTTPERFQGFIGRATTGKLDGFHYA